MVAVDNTNRTGAPASATRSDGLSHMVHHDSGVAGGAKITRNRSLSLSMPWRRPKSAMFTHGNDLQPLHQQFNDIAVDDSYDVPSQPRPLRRSSHAGHTGSIKGIFRRASMSIKGMVHRRPSIATEKAIDEEESSGPSRPTTGHSTWNRLRHPHGVRQTRSFYGLEITQEPLALTERPTYTSYHARPGIGGEPPIIPYNSGAAAKASAAMQNEFLARQNLHNKWLHPSNEVQNDGESGIGITVTAPEQDVDIIRIDFISQLPTELAISILAKLDAAALAKASLVSGRWRAVVKNQHVWRESCLRETTSAYAMSRPVQPDAGLGVPKVTPRNDWKQIYRVKKELEQRWKLGQARPVYLSGHTDSIYCLQFDEHKIITGSRDKTIRVWDMHTLECSLVIGPSDIVSNPELLKNANGEPAHFATEEPQKEKMALSLPKCQSFSVHHNASILCLQYDDKILATGSSDSTAIIYDIQDGYKPIMQLRHHTAAILDLAFDEKHIVTCSKDISICVWDRKTGALLRQLRGHTGPVNAVQMRGNTIVSCSGDFRVKLWNIDTGKNIREFVGHTKGLACSQFSQDGRYVASAGNDKAIRIWDANTGECVQEMQAHQNLVRSLHIDSVSGRLVSGSYDTDIKVWDMATGAQLLDFPHWHLSWVLSAKSDYRRIVSTGQDPKILIMDFGAEVEGIEMLESGDSNGRVFGGGFL